MSWDLDADGSPRVDGDQNVRQDAYDLATGGALLRGAPDWAAATDGGRIPLGHLAQDAWATFYKSNPQLGPDPSSAEARRARPLVERLMGDPATAQTRAATLLDETAAAIAALAAMPRLREEWDRAEQERRRQEGRQSGSGAGLPVPGPGQNQGEAARRAVRAAAVEAGKAVDQYGEVMAAWGLTPADLRTVAAEARVDAMRKLIANPAFRRMADLVGRMRNLARARQAQRLRREPDEIHGLETGGDLARLLPSELGALNHPLLRLDLWRRIQEGQALQYHLRERPRTGRGPMVVLLDSSGSMAAATRGETRMDRAKAVALALVDTARRQRRASAVLVFNHHVAWEASFPAGRAPNPVDLVKLASIAPDGGTSFDTPIAIGLGYVQGHALNPRELRAADLVLITDGQCDAAPATIAAVQAARQSMGMRVFSILIGTGSTASVAPFSNRSWSVADVGDDTAGELFEEVSQDGR